MRQRSRLAGFGSLLSCLVISLTLTLGCGARHNPDQNCTGPGCAGSGDTGGGDGGGACTMAQDCPSPSTQYCDSGACRNIGTNPSGCSVHTDCSGQLCNVATRTCVDCLNTDHCPVGEYCRANGSCGANAVGCTTDNECSPLRCDMVSSTCVQCLTQSDCPAGQNCRNLACFVEGGGNPQCSTQADCDPYGLICDTGIGDCVSCSNDSVTGQSDCALGLECQGGRCTNPSNPGGDGSCYTRDDCAGQACMLGYCMACFADFMCTEIMDFATGVTKLCDIYTGNCVDPVCTTADDCPAGQACYGGGHCGECIANEECRDGEVCNQGTCGPCSGSADCDSGETCNSGVCTPPTPGSVPFGGACTMVADCEDGMVCLQGLAGGICTRICIGSGQGGDADCPTGYACQNFESGIFDGIMLCNAADQLGAGTDGYPFTQAPGDSCASGNECQTGICDASQTCARTCFADRDCNGSGEVCRGITEALDDDALTGDHVCTTSDPAGLGLAGDSCTEHAECNSGLCFGTCSDGLACDGWWDCLDDCIGQCRDHCRSNADCVIDESCNAWPTVIDFEMTGWVPACMPMYGAGTRADGTSCTSYDQCASDWCMFDICTTPCAIAADCSGPLSGMTCQAVTFTGDPIFSMGFCL